MDVIKRTGGRPPGDEQIKTLEDAYLKGLNAMREIKGEMAKAAAAQSIAADRERAAIAAEIAQLFADAIKERVQFEARGGKP